MDNLSGHTIRGYRLHEQIGHGGFGMRSGGESGSTLRLVSR
jgi:hypothetical protein